MGGHALIDIYSSHSSLAGDRDFDPAWQSLCLPDNTECFGAWACRSLAFERAATDGRAVFIESNLAGAFAAFDLRLEDPEGRALLARVSDSIAVHQDGKTVPLSRCCNIRVDHIDIIAFRNGELSIKVRLAWQDGWTDDQFFATFGHANVNATTENLCPAITELLENFQRHFCSYASKIADHAERSLNAPDIRSLHICYGGDLTVADKALNLPDRVESLLYKPSLAPIQNQSNRTDTFVFIGYAFSIILGKEPDRALREYGILIRISHALFGSLSTLCAEVEEDLEASSGRLKAGTIRHLERKIGAYYHDLKSPIFTYRHEFLLIRDRLFIEWQLFRVMDRAEYLLRTLRNIAEDKQRRQEKRSDRAINLILLAIALISLTGVLVDLQMVGWIDLSQ